MTETTNRRDQFQHIVDVPNSINMVSLLGPNDEHLALLESAFDADIHVRGNRVTLRGESSEAAIPAGELAHGGRQVVFGEVGPETLQEQQLGVGRFPE